MKLRQLGAAKFVADNIIKNIIFGKLCHKCKIGRIRHIGSDFKNTWIEVYECNNCKEQFV